MREGGKREGSEKGGRDGRREGRGKTKENPYNKEMNEALAEKG